MTHLNFLTILTFLTTLTFSQQPTRLEIQALPPNHPSTESIYIAGSFNNWNPQDDQYRFQKDDAGRNFILLNLPGGNYEYKLTRGGWQRVETLKDGSAIGNRRLSIPNDTPISIVVEEWADRFPVATKRNSAGPNVTMLDTAFGIPQLGRSRRIWVYLPEDYSTSYKDYPVLYMHDGQNVFDDATSFSGEWGVDEALDTLGKIFGEMIVVAIDNGGEKRMNEYNPYDHERFGDGEGEEYLRFIVKTLKPEIDRIYRTKKKRKDTYIAGSSMGGLISFYAVLKYPKVFGGAGIFSPAFWTAGKKIDEDIRRLGRKVKKARLYFYMGQQEGETMVPDMLHVFELMNQHAKKTKMASVIRADERHHEASWRKEFPEFYKWMGEQD